MVCLLGTPFFILSQIDLHIIIPIVIFVKTFVIIIIMETSDYIPLKDYLEIVNERLKKVKDIYSLSNEERVRYERDLRFVRDCNATMTYATQQGIEKGIEQGIEQGVEKGKIQTAINLKKMGMDISTISKATGLPESRIESLK